MVTVRTGREKRKKYKDPKLDIYWGTREGQSSWNPEGKEEGMVGLDHRYIARDSPDEARLAPSSQNKRQILGSHGHKEDLGEQSCAAKRSSSLNSGSARLFLLGVAWSLSQPFWSHLQRPCLHVKNEQNSTCSGHHPSGSQRPGAASNSWLTLSFPHAAWYWGHRGDGGRGALPLRSR